MHDKRQKMHRKLKSKKKNMENTKGILNKTSFGKYVDCLFDEFKRQEKYYNNHVNMSIEIKNTQ